VAAPVRREMVRELVTLGPRRTPGSGDTRTAPFRAWRVAANLLRRWL